MPENSDDALEWRVLERTVAETKAANAGISHGELESAIDEAVEDIRSERFAK
jgi:hypothetical protein